MLTLLRFFVFLLAIQALPAAAATRIAKAPGFSGYIGLGVNSVRVESNLIAGDTGDDEIDDLGDSARAGSSSSLSPNLALTYSLDNRATEIFLGNSVEDFIRFDLTTAIGLRQQVNGAGIFEIAMLRSPSPTEIWSDPYAVGVERDETEREANGFRLEWGAIMQSGFDFRITRRENEIDDDNSGDALLAAGSISASERQVLQREGDLETTTLIYNWYRPRGESIALTANYIRHDLDGEAMSFDGYLLQLTNVNLLGPRLRLVTNLLLGQFEHDDSNPIFDETNDKRLTAATASVFLSDIFDAKGWIGNATVAFAEENNAIDFYDTTASFVSLGLLYRF